MYKIEKDIEFSKCVAWLACISSALFFMYELMQANMVASLVDVFTLTFSLDAREISLLSSGYYLSNVVFLFLAGWILDNFSIKKTMLFAMCLSIISTIILSKAHNYYTIFFCRILAGGGSAFCFLGPIRTVSCFFPAKKMALATGVIITLGMLGGMLAQYPLTLLIKSLGWRKALLCISWVGVILVFIMFLGIADKPLQAHKKNLNINAKETLKNVFLAYFDLQNLRAAFYTSLMNMPVAIFGALIGIVYLMSRLNIDKETAALINSMLFLGITVGATMVGWISDRIAQRILPMKIGCGVSFCLILYILFGKVSLVGMMILFFALGFFSSSQIISYALVAENSLPNNIATSVSVVSVITQGGYIVFQNLFAGMLSLYTDNNNKIYNLLTYNIHDYTIACLLLPVGIMLAFFMAYGIKETYCRQRQV